MGREGSGLFSFVVDEVTFNFFGVFHIKTEYGKGALSEFHKATLSLAASLIRLSGLQAFPLCVCVCACVVCFFGEGPKGPST